MSTPILTFSVNSYDSDGDTIEEGIYIYVNDVRFKIGAHVNDIDDIILQLLRIKAEILGHPIHSKEIGK